jgi:putative transposase
MRKSKFSDERMVAILREADRDPIAAVAKRHGISEQTIYTWRKRFGALQTDDVRRLKQLEAENARLKNLVGEHDLEIAIEKQTIKLIAWLSGAQSTTRRAICPTEAGKSAAASSAIRITTPLHDGQGHLRDHLRRLHRRHAALRQAPEAR